MSLCGKNALLVYCGLSLLSWCLTFATERDFLYQSTSQAWEVLRWVLGESAYMKINESLTEPNPLYLDVQVKRK